MPRRPGSTICALVMGIELVLADEPTGNLDYENSQTVLKFLREFVTDGGAVLLVTHDPVAAEKADRTIQLRDGRFEDQ